MKRLLVAVACLSAVLPVRAQVTSPIAGVWSLNRSLSQLPRELGFDVVAIPDADGPGSPEASGGGRGRRGAAGGRTPSSPPGGRRESSDDGRRRRLLTDEARTPPARLTLVDNTASIILTTELGQSRTLHPNNRDESVEIEGVPVTVSTARDGDRLVVTYHVEQDRDIQYTYSATGPRLSVETQFLERGKAGDKVTRIYEAGMTAAAAPPAAGTPRTAAPADSPRESFDQRPGAEFRGLTDVGIVVEDLASEATGCGLRRDAIENALAARLSAGGLRVRKNSDEDSYVYVNIITNAMPNGTCVSRFDAFLYTHATAKLAYRDQPVLVQVSLMHRGGIGTSAIASHAAAVSRGLEGYVDAFLARIRDANK